MNPDPEGRDGEYCSRSCDWCLMQQRPEDAYPPRSTLSATRGKLEAPNAGLSVHSSYTTHPSAHTSPLNEYGLPSITSGACEQGHSG
jgi:hypothetical protein